VCAAGEVAGDLRFAGTEQIDRAFRKWLKRIPLPLRPQDRKAGYDWALSIWQMEVSLTQIFDRPLRGREFFEEIIGDNLDLGRPDRVQLIFDRVVTKKTPGEFRTRVIQEGVHPSLHIQYKNFDLKQSSRKDAAAGRKGPSATPVTEDGEKAPSLKFGHPRVMALLLALTLFQHSVDGFHNRDLRGLVADLLKITTEQYTASQMTYDLRRLRLKGLIFRPPRTNRYFVTPYGWKVARLFSRLEARVFRPAMAMFTANDAVLPFPLRQALDRVDAQLDMLIYDAFPLPKAS
jgi:hypothetical protein